MRPLEVVYNRHMIARLKEFLSSEGAWQGMSSPVAASRLGGVVERVDHTLLDHLTVEMNISAPHVIVPESFTDPSTSLVGCTLNTCMQ